MLNGGGDVRVQCISGKAQPHTVAIDDEIPFDDTGSARCLLKPVLNLIEKGGRLSGMAPCGIYVGKVKVRHNAPVTIGT